MSVTVYSRDLYAKYTAKRLAELRKHYSDGSKAVIVAKGHHNTDYYDATTYDACLASCLRLLRNYYDGGWLSVSDEPPREPDFTEESILLFPEGSKYRLQLDNEWKQFREAQNRHAENALRLGWVRDALDSGDGGMAYAALGDLCDRHSDPGFALEWLTSA